MRPATTVKITVNSTIERNPQSWIEDNTKSLQALKIGIEQQILAEIDRLKRVTAVVIQSKNITVDAALHEQTGVILDYLYLQLHKLFPEKHILPTINYSAPFMRQWSERIAAKDAKETTVIQKRRRIPRKYCIWIVVVSLLLLLGLLIGLIWATLG
jgi:hypothetical protein